jgi:hypothetical protein
MENAVAVQEGHAARDVIRHSQDCHGISAPAAAVKLPLGNRALHTVAHR